MYRAFAVNLDLQTNWDEHKAVHYYNQRGEASVNRIKELRSDFAGTLCHVTLWRQCGVFQAVCVSLQSVGAAATIAAGWLGKQAGDHDTGVCMRRLRRPSAIGGSGL